MLFYLAYFFFKYLPVNAKHFEATNMLDICEIIPTTLARNGHRYAL